MIPVIAFFHNKGGVGQTTLIYNLAWKLSDLGIAVLTADLDPQPNLTAAFFDEDELETIWPEPSYPRQTIFESLQPLIRGTGDIAEIPARRVSEYLYTIPGDIALLSFEDELSAQWVDRLSSPARSLRVASAIWRILQSAARRTESQVILIDLGPNMGSINRAALVASDFVVIPVAPDLFALQGLRNLGPTLCRWREDWKHRLQDNPDSSLTLPRGDMTPLGYVVLQHALRLDRPVRTYEKWMDRISLEYARSVLEEEVSFPGESDANQIGLVRHYGSLIAMAQEARKPIFHLKPADGALGAHLSSAQAAGKEFEDLARELMRRAGVAL